MPVDVGDDVLIISSDKALIETNIPVNFQIDGEYHGTESRLRFCFLTIKVAIP
jgi:diacylglycerol kinase family enzyme